MDKALVSELLESALAVARECGTAAAALVRSEHQLDGCSPSMRKHWRAVVRTDRAAYDLAESRLEVARDNLRKALDLAD